MRFVLYLVMALALVLAISAEQQRVLRRVIKSTPTANNLARVRLVTVRSTSAESGAVAEITSKEAASFGQRSANETTQQQSTSQQQSASGTKSKVASGAPTITTTAAPSTSTPSATTSSPTTKQTVVADAQPELKPKSSDRQQAAPQAPEVEILSSAPSSWQTMTAVEAPVAMLIATGTRAAASDLASSSSTLQSSEESVTGDFLRQSATKGGASYSQHSVGESSSRIRQQQSTNKQQQSYFYPAQQTRAQSKTSNSQGTKTHWYQPPTTTHRPAPLIQEQYEQQNEQYVEQQQQQQQVEYGAAPQGQAEPFAFDFKTLDNSGNGQYRKEESDKNGVVRGSYGYTDANGIYRHVEYVADQNGFRANIKSNEPGLIGETQPASIQLAGGAPPAANQRLSTSSNENADWTPSSNSNNQGSSADLALAPPDFESSHKSERIRAPRQFHN